MVVPWLLLCVPWCTPVDEGLAYALAGSSSAEPASAPAAGAEAGPADEPGARRGAVSLYWEAPAGCPNADEVLERVESGLGLSLEEVAAVTVRGTVTRAEAWVLELEVENDAGVSVRSLDGESCEVLADAAALVISISLDPVATVLARGQGGEGAGVPGPQGQAGIGGAEGAEASGGQPREPMPGQAPIPAPALDRVPDPVAPQARVRGLAAFSGGLGLGLLPDPTAAIRGDLGLEGEHWQVTAGGEVQTGSEVDVQLDTAMNARAVFWSARGIVAGCGVPTHRRLRFPLCATGGVGTVTGFGRGVENPRLDRQLLITLGARAAVIWRPRPWIGLYGRGELDAVLRRPGFAFDDLGLVHRTAPVGGTLSVGAQFVFP